MLSSIDRPSGRDRFEVLHNEVEEGANLVALVIPRLSTCWLLSRIIEVDELQYQLKAATRHDAPKNIILI